MHQDDRLGELEVDLQDQGEGEKRSAPALAAHERAGQEGRTRRAGQAGQEGQGRQGRKACIERSLTWNGLAANWST